MAGVVKFTLDASDAKAVGAFMRVVDAQKKTERELKKISKAGKQTTSTMGGLGKSILGLTGGLIGAAGLKMAFGALSQGMEKISEKTVQFEDELTGLLHLGKNVENIVAIKGAVLDMSGAFGISRKLIADTMFSLQSGASDLAKEIRDNLLKESIMLNKVTGATLPTSLKVLMKTYRIYGKELGSVTNAANKLVKIEQEAELNFEEMGGYLPDVMAAAKQFGYTIDEVGAALMVMTKGLGKTEKTMTATRNIFLKINDAEKLGIELTGDFTNKIKQLSEAASPEQLKKIFGIEAIAGAGILVAEVDNLAKAHATLKKEQGDILKNKYLARLEDEAYRYSEISKSIKEMNENLILSGKYIKTTGKITQEQAFTELGIKEAMGPWEATFGKLAKPYAWLLTVAEQIDKAGLTPEMYAEVRGTKGRLSTRFLERGRGAFLETQERAGAEGTILGRQQRERWGMGPTTAIGAGEGTDKLDIAADKIIIAADKIIAASETTDKAMSNISRGITSRN